MARVFVVWDSRLRDVGVTMKALRGAPDRVGGHHVDILGAPGDERIGVIDANLRERVAACDGILAYVDHPNANMAWELGRGLGLRREGPRVRATLATQSSQHGGWVRDTLLDGVLQQVDGSRRQVVRRLLDNLDAWIALAPPEPGDRTVVLCPDGGSGELLREGIEGARLGGVLRLDDVRLLDLPDRLRGVGRCAWVLPPQRDDDPGHGVENTIHALIAGYLDAAGVPLRVFTHHDAPVVADLSGRHARWDDEEELLHHLDAWLTTTRPLGSADRRTPSDVLALWRDLARERHAHTTPLLPERSDRTLDAVCVRVQVEARDSHEPRAPVGFRRDAAPLKELVEARLLLPGPVRAVVSGAPGSGKTTLARHLAWELAGEDRLPVYVPLAGLHGHPLDHADRELLDARAGASAGRLKEALADAARGRGRVWLLLDGLDEVPRGQGADAPYADCLRRIRDLAADPALKDAVIVVLSREVSAGELGWERLEVQPLDAARQRDLLDRLRDVELIAPQVAAAIAASLDAWDPRLVGNPLLLTLVALTAAERHGRGERPVQDRVTVLHDAVGWLLSRRYRPDARPPSHREEEHLRALRAVLRRLALRWHELGEERWPTAKVREVVRQVWAELPATLAGEAASAWPGGHADLLDELDRQGGVVGRADGEQWGWLHRSMRELLAAEELAARAPADRAAYVDAQIGRLPALRGVDLYRQHDETRETRERYAHWGELIGLLAGLVPDELDATVARLATRAPAAAARTVVAAEGPAPWHHLRLLLDLEPDDGVYYPWDNDDLDAVLRTIGRRGDGPEGLWRAVSPERDARQLGALWYALRRSGQRVDPGRFFAAAGRPMDRAPRVVVRSRGDALRGVGPLDVLPVVEVAAGAFRMGSPEGEGYDDERPLHDVRLTRAFRLGVAPVTVAQYRRFDPEHACPGGDHHPVTGVDWFQAALFAAWVGGRLPTEAEWEYACRAGTETRWSCGDDEAALGEHAWYGANSGQKTHPVGERRPNPWGLYDMHGNVWEWTSCRWLRTYAGPAVDPEGPGAGGGRVVRGGAAWVDAVGCRSAFRDWGHPVSRVGSLGFRVALPAPSPGPSSMEP